MKKVTPKNELPILSRQKKILFTCILIIIPFLLVAFLELSLRLVDYGTNLDLFVKSTDHPGFYEVNKNVADRFFSKNKGTDPSNDIFLIKKPETSYRIFVMGCSTTRGFPYNSGTTFSRILNYRLQDVFPNKKIEVINTAMAAVNSFTQADFIDEIIAQKPDAILIYTGHNEFYGALGVGSVENGGNVRWLKKLHLALIQFRTYQLIQKMVTNISKHIGSDSNIRVTSTLMERIVKNKAIDYDADIYNQAIQDFKYNMSEVLQKAQNKNIPVLFGDVVSNIRDQKPFQSSKIANQPTADEAFLMARDYELKGNYDSARTFYYKAKDLDGVRFRAPEDINNAIYEISAKYNAHIVPVKQNFENNSPHNLIGNSLMIEHLHPNIEGYFLMADVFFNAMHENKLISAQWDSSLIKPSIYYRSTWGFTALDSLIADIKTKSLMAGWPFKPNNVVNRYIYEYKPKNYEDSLAIMCVVYKNIFIEDKHIELAKHYMRQGKYMKAFNEYNSLIRKLPHISDLYIEAEQYASLAGEYQRGLDLLLTFPELDSSYIINTKIGKLYQQLKAPNKAIFYYEKALKVVKTNNKELLLISLYSAYIEMGDQKKATNVLYEIKKIKPNFNPNVDLNKKDVIIVVDKDSKVLIDKAIVLAKNNRLDEALDLLFQAQKIKETALSNQLIGSILYKKNNPDALKYILKAYYDNPTDPNLLNNIVVIYAMRKDFKTANKYMKELKAVTSDQNRIKKLEDYILKNLN